MTVFALDIATIVDLDTRVAQAGAMQAMEASPDKVFDHIVAVVMLGCAGDGE